MAPTINSRRLTEPPCKSDRLSETVRPSRRIWFSSAAHVFYCSQSSHSSSGSPTSSQDSQQRVLRSFVHPLCSPVDGRDRIPHHCIVAVPIPHHELSCSPGDDLIVGLHLPHHIIPWLADDFHVPRHLCRLCSAARVSDRYLVHHPIPQLLLSPAPSSFAKRWQLMVHGPVQDHPSLAFGLPAPEMVSKRCKTRMGRCTG